MHKDIQTDWLARSKRGSAQKGYEDVSSYTWKITCSDVFESLSTMKGYATWRILWAY